MTTNANPSFLTDDTLTDDEWVDELRAFLKPAMDAINAELERLHPPAEIERRLAQVKAAAARAGRDSNPRAAG